MRFERIYLVAMTYLVAILITAFALSGCKALGSLTAPPEGLTGRDAFSLTTNMSNSSGEPTILDAQIIVDRVVVADSCPEEDQFPDFDADGNQAGTYLRGARDRDGHPQHGGSHRPRYPHDALLHVQSDGDPLDLYRAPVHRAGRRTRTAST